MQKRGTFIRTVYLTAVIILILSFGIYGVFESYEKIKEIYFGEYRNAVEINQEKIIFLDLKKEIND